MAQLATGIQITFGSGFLATIEDVDVDEMNREMVQSSHFGTGQWHEFLAGKLVDPGGLTVEMQHDGTKQPPIANQFETCTVALADGTGFSVQAAMRSYKFRGSLEDKVMGTAVLKFSGAITFDITPT